MEFLEESSVEEVVFDLDGFVQKYEEAEEETALEMGKFFLPDQTYHKQSLAKGVK